MYLIHTVSAPKMAEFSSYIQRYHRAKTIRQNKRKCVLFLNLRQSCELQFHRSKFMEEKANYVLMC